MSAPVGSKINLKNRCYRFSLEVIRSFPVQSKLNIHKPVMNQLIGSSTSIGANIVEAKSAHSKKDFIKYYEIALKSANETKYWLHIVKDGYELTDNDLMKKFITEVDELSKIIASSILKLKKT